MGEFLLTYCFLALPLFAFVSLRIWRPASLSGSAMSVSDRIAWTVFTFGISLMLNMVLCARLGESDGDYRTWDKIRLHGRVFLALTLIPVAGPLIVFLCQKKTLTARSLGKKPPVDDLG
jgi:hypothetical protein